MCLIHALRRDSGIGSWTDAFLRSSNKNYLGPQTLLMHPFIQLTMCVSSILFDLQLNFISFLLSNKPKDILFNVTEYKENKQKFKF